MWILILTLMTGEGAMVSSVPGFTSETTCRAAGAEWQGQAADLRRSVRAAFICKPA